MQENVLRSYAIKRGLTKAGRKAFENPVEVGYQSTSKGLKPA